MSKVRVSVLKTIISENLIDNVNKKGAMLRKGLEDALANHPHVGNIRGRGLFQGLEIVSNKQTKEPFDSSLKLHAKIKAAALEEGLMCYPMGGTVDGLKGDHVMFSPPFIINDSHVEEIVGSFTKALNKSLSAI
jgi:adenosylmethionine-8-amino-7-oxononanoate aminotransferase